MPLTRIMSAVFRKGGDVAFLVEEMKAVFDPRGGYFKAGGVYMPSLVAELGSIVADHLKSIGMLHDPEMSEHQRGQSPRRHRSHWRWRNLPAQRQHVPQVQHQGAGDHGWLCNVFELRVQQMRITGRCAVLIAPLPASRRCTGISRLPAPPQFCCANGCAITRW